MRLCSPSAEDCRLIMRLPFFHFLLACVSLAAVGPCHAFTCADSKIYQQGQRELSLVRQTATAHFIQTANYIQRKGRGPGAALVQLEEQASSPDVRLYDIQLNDLGARIKQARQDSPQACEALLNLQLQRAYVGQQKIDFIAKRVMGEDSARPNQHVSP